MKNKNDQMSEDEVEDMEDDEVKTESKNQNGPNGQPLLTKTRAKKSIILNLKKQNKSILKEIQK